MQLTVDRKQVDGSYVVSSRACPKCNSTCYISLDSAKLFAYNQGAPVQIVLENYDPAIRERFVSGVCEPCWDILYGVES